MYMSEQVVFGKTQRVVKTLSRRIKSGELNPGDRLMGEHHLAQEFSVSRGTIRQALGELQRLDLIATQSGVGSFVTFDGVSLDQSIGWARALADSGTEIVTQVLGIDRVAWREVIRLPDGVEIPEGATAASAVRIRRLRRQEDGRGVSLETSTVPAVGPLARLPETGLVDNSLSVSLEAAGLRTARGDQDVTVVRLDQAEASLLDRQVGDAFLRTSRTSWTADGRFVENVISILDPDRFRLHLTFGSPA